MALINDTPNGVSGRCDADTSQVFQESSEDLEHTWFLDSRCSRHMTSLKSLLIDFMEKDGLILVFGDNSEEVVMGVGTFECKMFKLKNVFYVKGMKSNLAFISQLSEIGYKV